MIRHQNNPAMPSSHLPFSPAVLVGELLFVSGQASTDPTGNIISGTFEEEMRRTMENLSAVLAACGSGMRHVVQTRNYVRDSVDLALYNKLYREYFAAPYPARTTLTNCLDESLRYEIECIAVVPKE